MYIIHNLITNTMIPYVDDTFPRPDQHLHSRMHAYNARTSPAHSTVLSPSGTQVAPEGRDELLEILDRHNLSEVRIVATSSTYSINLRSRNTTAIPYKKVGYFLEAQHLLQAIL